MTKAEFVWLLVLGALITWVILGTLDNEMAEVRQRMAVDTLEHLAGMLSLSLEERDPAALDLPRAGPGRLPAGLGTELQGALAEWLPEDAFLPSDPWGGAYVLVRLFQSENAAHLMLVSGGPEGRVNLDERKEGEFAEFITVARRR